MSLGIEFSIKEFQKSALALNPHDKKDLLNYLKGYLRILS